MINIYTDGSFNQQSKKGGWAFVCVSDKVILKNGEVTFDPENRGALISELVALFQAIKYAAKQFPDESVKIHLDCQGLLGLINKIKNGEGVGAIDWLTAKLKGILYFVISAKNVIFEYVNSGKSLESEHGLAHCLAAAHTGIKLKPSAKQELSFALKKKKYKCSCSSSSIPVVCMCSKLPS